MTSPPYEFGKPPFHTFGLAWPLTLDAAKAVFIETISMSVTCQVNFHYLFSFIKYENNENYLDFSCLWQQF
jgi:hypothetical protein